MAITTVLIAELALVVDQWILSFIWGFYSLVLTWVLCTSLQRIRAFMKAMKLNAFLPSRVLISLHLSLFVAASSLGILFFILDVPYKLAENS